MPICTYLRTQNPQMVRGAGDLGVTDHDPGEEEEGVAGEVQDRDECRSDDVVRHVGPEEGVLPEDAGADHHPEEVEHREVAGPHRTGALSGFDRQELRVSHFRGHL
jgi:hypothetical protein